MTRCVADTFRPALIFEAVSTCFGKQAGLDDVERVRVELECAGLEVDNRERSRGTLGCGAKVLVITCS